MTEPLISLRTLSKRFGQALVLDAIDLDIGRGEVLVIIGPSGSGKSTLVRCINGLEPPSSGSVTVDGRTIAAGDHRAWRKLREDIGMVFQDYSLFPHLTVLRNMTLAPVRRGRTRPRDAEATALALLERVGLADKAMAYPAELSGGQQQRVAIVRALAMAPKAMLFDEPTSALDPETVSGILDVMRGLARDGMTMVIVTHEMNFARDVADRVVFMDAGRIVEMDRPDVLFGRPRAPRTREFLGKILRHS